MGGRRIAPSRAMHRADQLGNEILQLFCIQISKGKIVEFEFFLSSNVRGTQAPFGTDA